MNCPPQQSRKLCSSALLESGFLAFARIFKNAFWAFFLIGIKKILIENASGLEKQIIYRDIPLTEVQL